MAFLDNIVIICGLHLAVAISPGPNTVAICCAASRGSRRAGLWVAAGVVTATSLWVGTVLLGAGSVVAQNSGAFQVLLLLSGAYLSWIGLGMLATSGARRGPATCSRPFLLGLLTALSNPVALAFWMGTFLTAIPANVPDYFNAALFLLIILQSTVVYFVLAVLSSLALPGRIFGAARGLRRIGGAAMLLIGLNALLAP